MLALVRDQVGGIILGAVFVALGLAAWTVAALRGRGGNRVLVWFGVFDVLYGLRILASSPAAFSLLPRSVWPARLYVVSLITYLIIIPSLLFSAELCGGPLRRWLKLAALPALAVTVLGVASVFRSDALNQFVRVNNVLVLSVIGVMVAVNTIPWLARKLRIVRSPISIAGTLVLAAGVVYSNLMYIFRRPYYHFVEPLALVTFVFALGYLAAEKIFANERRLVSIESELAIAREIQNSSLPSSIPKIQDLAISATYLPMTAVAGDFYDFIPVDRNRIGILVADVSGHGVPAALIASMIKVAMQSVVSCASRPAELLRGLNRILSSQLRGQFVTAAYLWVDTEAHTALYSAAGHPPLLLWSQRELLRIESNGLLFGISAAADYPVRELSLRSGDRLLLSTDGVTEPENAAGEAFGHRRLEQVVRESQEHSPAELSEKLMAEIRRWQPPSVTQEDDITLVVVDVA